MNPLALANLPCVSRKLLDTAALCVQGGTLIALPRGLTAGQGELEAERTSLDK